MSSDLPEVLVEKVENSIATLTIDRPDAMNSMNGALVDALKTKFLEMNTREDVRVVILTASGDRVFCAGADLKERRGMSDEEVAQRIRDYKSAFSAIAECSKPVICALNGHAFGGGLEIALSCDIRVLAEEAQVGLTELRLGIIPGAGGTQRLARLIGASKAKEMMFRGLRLGGQDALDWGVVSHCVPRSELSTYCRSLAEEIAKAAPIAIKQAKLAVDRGIELPLQDALDFEAECYALTIPTEDRLEGLKAFAEKREPVWKNK
ncbi:enoyl-CoA hydratase [Microvenator marinus]|uniref:Enoyl-CoA hydratase n=1 Tax=Microvenator marinus TaxID=2600177 RepID=A0A5B8XP82_9DELT|nr:enoyl-CoA hydratase-related protein [Microvenator marinus]QED27460.1 enoyl-CoA hydratase [Microvenator marinus]